MAKKSIFESDNPVMNFITTNVEADEEAPAPKAQKIPAGYKKNPALIETKSKRVQLLIQPSVYAKAKQIADSKGISVNEYIHEAIEKAVRKDR